MTILSTPGWEDYELLDSGNGYRLERFGRYILKRPDPQLIWKPRLDSTAWEKADAAFEDKWITKGDMPRDWEIKYRDLRLLARLSPFKHTGIFPEQVRHWDWMRERIKQQKGGANILNLFGYTGGATLAAAAEGAVVTHVDASRPTIGWARENQAVSGLGDKPIRWILDDAVKFAQREVRRGSKYDGIIMDPPIYGHGPGGEKWDFFQSFPQLFDTVQQLLSDTPLFVIVNAYAVSASALMLENILKDMGRQGEIESGELALEEKGGRLLSTGIFSRWSRD